jgi:hypothetical protein
MTYVAASSLESNCRALQIYGARLGRKRSPTARRAWLIRRVGVRGGARIRVRDHTVWLRYSCGAYSWGTHLPHRVRVDVARGFSVVCARGQPLGARCRCGRPETPLAPGRESPTCARTAEFHFQRPCREFLLYAAGVWPTNNHQSAPHCRPNRCPIRARTRFSLIWPRTSLPSIPIARPLSRSRQSGPQFDSPPRTSGGQKRR